MAWHAGLWLETGLLVFGDRDTPERSQVPSQDTRLRAARRSEMNKFHLGQTSDECRQRGPISENQLHNESRGTSTRVFASRFSWPPRACPRQASLGHLVSLWPASPENREAGRQGRVLRGAEVPARDGVRAAAVCGQRLTSSCAEASPAPASTRASCLSELSHPTPTLQQPAVRPSFRPLPPLGAAFPQCNHRTTVHTVAHRLSTCPSDSLVSLGPHPRGHREPDISLQTQSPAPALERHRNRMGCSKMSGLSN